MSNETIFREVDEELRGDRLRAFWKRFGPFIIGAAVAVVLVVAINEGWTWWQNSSASRSSDQFYAALELAEDGDLEGAQAALNDVVAEGSGGYPTLARFRQASLLVREGKTDEAITAYDALATAETNQRLRELALVLSAFLLVDSGNVGAVNQRVGALASADGPMRNPAREAIGLAQYAAGELEPAMTTFETILADPLAGTELRSRVQIYVAQLMSLGAGDETTAAPEVDAAAATGPVAEAVDSSVGDAPAMDVVDPALDAAVPAAAAELPAIGTVPAEPAPASEATPVVAETAPDPAATAEDKGAADARAAIAGAEAPAN